MRSQWRSTREGGSLVADKRCENGHFIDESWDLCPYCPGESAESDIAVVRPTRAPEAPPRRPTAVPPPAGRVENPSHIPAGRVENPSHIAVAPPMERT